LTLLVEAPEESVQRLAFYFLIYGAAALVAHVAGKLVEWRLT
jgi:hypothetical protein